MVNGRLRAGEQASPAKNKQIGSADVKTQARQFGRAVGEKVVAYAKSQGWLAAPEVAFSRKSG